MDKEVNLKVKPLSTLLEMNNSSIHLRSYSLWHVSLHGLFRLLFKFAFLIKDLYDFGGCVCIRHDDLLDISFLYHECLSQWGSNYLFAVLQIYCKNYPV